MSTESLSTQLPSRRHGSSPRDPIWARGQLCRRGVSALTAATLAVCSMAPVLVLSSSASAAVKASPAASSPAATSGGGAGRLEAAASRAGETGRKVAMSLIGLGFAVAAIVLSFKRDFKEAAGIFAVGLVAVLLATPAGLNLLRDTVTSLFGG